MRGKGPWLSIKSIFAPTEVAASLALIVLVIVFTLVYFGARHQPNAATHSTAVAGNDTSPAPDVSPSPSADRSPVAQPATDNGLGAVIRAALVTAHRRGSGTTPTPVSPTDTATPSPSDTTTPTPTDTPTPTPSDTSTPTPTATPVPIPTDTATPPPTPSTTDLLSPSPSPSLLPS